MYDCPEIAVHYRIATMGNLVCRIIRIVLCHNKIPAPDHICIAYLPYRLHRALGFNILISEFLIEDNHYDIARDKCLWGPEIDISILLKPQ